MEAPVTPKKSDRKVTDVKEIIESTKKLHKEEYDTHREGGDLETDDLEVAKKIAMKGADRSVARSKV